MEYKLVDKFRTMWHALYDNITNDNFDISTLKTQFPFLQIAKDSQFFISIFNFQTSKSDFVSDNVEEILGNRPEESSTKSLNNHLRYIHPSHQQYIIVGTKLFSNLVNNRNDLNWSDVIITFLGIRYNHPTKGEIRLSWQMYFLNNGNSRPIHALCIIRDVTHLVKYDFYWCRVTTVQNQLLSAFHSELNIDHSDDVLSTREKEVLKLILEGKETEEIASSLFISRITVNNHRQNILNKIGAKDTTALITICKLCNLVS